MKSSPLLGVLFASSLLAGCGTSCPPPTCTSGVIVDLGDLGARFPADLPVTVSACAGSSCAKLLVSGTGASESCAVQSGSATCDVVQGDVSPIVAFAGADAGSSTTVQVSVTGSGGKTVYSSMQTVPVSSLVADPGCSDSCPYARATFTP